MTKIKILLASFFMIAALSASADSDGIQTMLHYGHPIDDFVISYDERYILTRSEGEVCVWDLNSRMLVATLPIFTSEIFAHPTDSRLFYADTRQFKAKEIEDPTLATYDIIDWTTGKRIGKVSSNKMPKFFAGSDFTFVKKEDTLIMLATLDDDFTHAGTIGGLSQSAGSARSNSTDSLLLTTGKMPQLWDLRHACPAGAMPHHGRVRDAYFKPGTDNLIFIGKDTVAISGDNVIPVSGADLTGQLSLYGGKGIALSMEHLYKSNDGKSFEKMPAFRDAAKGRAFTTVSRAYGNGKFLVGSDNTLVDRIGDKGESLIEGSFDSDKPNRFARNKYNKIRDIKIAPHDDYAVITHASKGVSTLDLRSLQYISDLSADYKDLELVTCSEIMPDETIITGTSMGKLNFWKKGETKSSRQSSVHHARINSITLSADSSRMFTSDKAGQITVWDVKTQEPIVYIYQVADDSGTEYIFMTPDHYYKATPNMSRYINFVKDGQPYAFEQFDLRNNRPDIVLSRLGGDAGEIELLKKAWQKRLRRSGISEKSLSADFHVPTAAVNRKEIPFISTEGNISLDVVFADTKYDLKEITVTINGVPVLSPDKRRVSGRSYNLKENVSLATGNNEIAVWCTNTKGTSSLRETFYVTYTPTQQIKPDLYVVAAGVSGYADSRYNLGYAAKDAGDFVKTLEKRAADKFGHIKTLTLTDSQVTKESLNQIRSFLAGSRPDDVALVFFAGHGVLDKELDYYLAAYDMNFSDPTEGGIAYDDFMGVFEGVPALKRACFIDACHSGELDKEDYMAVNTVDMPAGEELMFRAAGQNVSAKEDVERVNTILSDMFRDTRWGVGATVLSSAGGGELAVESPEWNNGLFTYCLLKGIRDNAADTDRNGSISLREWIDFTRRNVADMSEGRQSPTLRSQNYHNDLEIK